MPLRGGGRTTELPTEGLPSPKPLREGELCVECYLYGQLKSGMILIQGPPASGKTTLAKACARLALQDDQPVLFLSTESSPGELEREMRSWGVQASHQVRIVDCYDVPGSSSPSLADLPAPSIDPVEVADCFAQDLRDLEKPYVLVDGLHSFALDAGEDSALRFALTCCRAVKRRELSGCATLTTGARSSRFETVLRDMFQGVVELQVEEAESTGRLQRFLRIYGLKGVEHPTERYPIAVTSEGIMIGTEEYRASLPPRHVGLHFFRFLDAAEEAPPTDPEFMLTWDDLGGLHEVKQVLRETIEYPWAHPEQYRDLKIRPPKGILFYGPPGTGKTFIVKVVASVAKASFLSIRSPDLLTGPVGESEARIRELFAIAREHGPSIIFFDEIDVIATKRRVAESSDVSYRIVTQLLTEMDGLITNTDVIVLAATNRPGLIDSALLRPGRFDKLVYVPPPDQEARRHILRNLLKGKPLEEDVVLDDLVDRTEGYSSADLSAVYNEAATNLIRSTLKGRSRERIVMGDFIQALEKIKPSITPEMLNSYAQFQASRAGDSGDST